MIIQITPDNDRTSFLLVEAIYKGFHVRYYRFHTEILGEHTEEDEEYIANRLSGTRPRWVYDLDEWAKNLVKVIEKDPDSRIIQVNSFEYVDGAVPDQY
jgi:hypothetical protein